MVQRNRPRERVSPGFHCTKKSSVGRVYLEPTLDQFPVGLLAQLVERFIGIGEVIG